jgi:uncharacterized OB-fold protein
MNLGPPLTITGHRCVDCGRAAFPPDPYGCEKCGATVERLEPIELAAMGRIHAVATVHRHHNDRPETPFTVATIVLDGGPTLKAVLTADLSEASLGARVVGVTVPWTGNVSDDSNDISVDNQIVDLHFEIAGAKP